MHILRHLSLKRLQMADRIEPIPPGFSAIAGYVSGNWPTATEKWFKDYPAKYKLTIAIHADEDALALDCEPGDEWPISQRVAVWIRRQQARGIYRPVVYTSAAFVDELVGMLINAGLDPTKDFRVWSAHYGLGPHLCGLGCSACRFHVDGTQYTDHADGENLDESILVGDFFDFKPPVDHRLAIFDTVLRDVHGHRISERGRIKAYYEAKENGQRDQLAVIRGECRELFNRLWTVVHTDRRGRALPKDSKQAQENWEKFNRRERAKQLWRASQGTL